MSLFIAALSFKCVVEDVQRAIANAGLQRSQSQRSICDSSQSGAARVTFYETQVSFLCSH